MRITLRNHQRGFTLLEIMIVVAILGLLVAVAMPSFLKTRTQARKQICVENLSQIESAKQIWGMENQKKNGDVPEMSDLVGANLYIKKEPECPASGTYDLKEIGASPTCTIEGHVLPPI